MIIRLANLDDWKAIAEFNCALARETEDHELNAEIVAKGVKRGLDRMPEARYFVAEVEDSIIGQLMVTREWSDWRDGWIWWIQSVYVRKDHRKKGVFRELLQRVSDDAVADPDVVGIRLYVEIDNEPAQAVYRRSGFVDPNYRVLERIFE